MCKSDFLPVQWGSTEIEKQLLSAGKVCTGIFPVTLSSELCYNQASANFHLADRVNRSLMGRSSNLTKSNTEELEIDSEYKWAIKELHKNIQNLY